MPSLALLHGKVFETRIVESEAELRTAQELRYLAYCEDHGFLDSRQYPEGLEADADDSRAAHVLLFYRPTGLAVGTVRLVLPHAPFPVERLRPGAWLEALPDFERSRTAEVSRLCLSRKRLRDKRHLRDLSRRLGLLDRDGMRVVGLATLGLLRGILALSRERRITQWCAMMSPCWLRALRRLGVHLGTVGPPVQCAGWKRLVWTPVEPVAARLRRERPEFWPIVASPLAEAPGELSSTECTARAR